MLAGMSKGISESMFKFGQPEVGVSAPGDLPTVPDIDKAREDLKNPRVVKATGHHVRIFDLHDAAERKDYEKTMLVLFDGTVARTHVIHASVRQVLPRQDGSSGWFSFIEWTEYVDTKPEKGDKSVNKAVKGKKKV